jgi:PadR family transcriptional regulator, regulatory protein PadR
MGDDLNLTHRALKLLALMLDNIRREYAGIELMELTGIPSGNLYPLLIKLQQAGILESRWEDVDPKEAGRNRRRYYRLSTHGVEVAQNVLRELAVKPAALAPGWARR